MNPPTSYDQPECLEDVKQYLRDLREAAAFQRDCYNPDKGGTPGRFGQGDYWRGTYGCATIMLDWLEGLNTGHSLQAPRDNDVSSQELSSGREHQLLLEISKVTGQPVEEMEGLTEIVKDQSNEAIGEEKCLEIAAEMAYSGIRYEKIEYYLPGAIKIAGEASMSVQTVGQLAAEWSIVTEMNKN